MSDEPENSGQQDGSWLDDLFDRFTSSPAPASPKPPSPPPDTKIPGTPQYMLIQAQDAVETNDAYRPQFKQDGTLDKSFCNVATFETVKAVNGSPMEEFKYPGGREYSVANLAAGQLAMSKSWQQISPIEAQNLANQGTAVIGVQKNPSGMDIW
jgi:hypothetical protein